jgi:hypothetical protein
LFIGVLLQSWKRDIRSLRHAPETTPITLAGEFSLGKVPAPGQGGIGRGFEAQTKRASLGAVGAGVKTLVSGRARWRAADPGQ